MVLVYPQNPTAVDRLKYSWQCMDFASRAALALMQTYSFSFPRICPPEFCEQGFRLEFPDSWEIRYAEWQRNFGVRIVTRVVPTDPPTTVTGFDCVGLPVSLLFGCNAQGGCASFDRIGCREDFPINKPGLSP